jgi:hypothetical protein
LRGSFEPAFDRRFESGECYTPSVMWRKNHSEPEIREVMIQVGDKEIGIPYRPGPITVPGGIPVVPRWMLKLLRYGPDGEVIGVTIINAKWLLERDGRLTITLPHSVRVEAGELATALG